MLTDAQKYALQACDPVRCEQYNCTLPAETCAKRTLVLTRYPWEDHPRYPICAKCETGQRRRDWLVMAGWQPPKGYALRNLLRPDHESQHAARRRWLASSVPIDYARRAGVW